MHMNWTAISEEPGLTEAFMIEHQNYLDWTMIFLKQTLTDDMIENMQHKVRWNWVSRCVLLDENFMLKHMKRLEWYQLFSRQKISLSLLLELEKNGQGIQWDQLSLNQFLEAEVMEYYKNQLDWDTISVKVPLTEKRMEQFSDELYWGYVAKHQTFSYEFALKHLYKFELINLKKNKKIKFSTEQWEMLEKEKNRKGWM